MSDPTPLDYGATLAKVRLELAMMDEEYHRELDALVAQTDEVSRLAGELAAAGGKCDPLPLVGGLQVRNQPVATAPYPPNLEEPWYRLEPAPGVLDLTRIEAAIGTHRPFSLRILTGVFAPSWLQAATGTVPYLDPFNPDRPAVPLFRYWTLLGRLATSSLFARVAHAIDGRIPYVWASGASTLYAEPMQRGFGGADGGGAVAGAANRAAFRAAGFTVDDDLVALREAVECMRGFRRTRVGMAFNPYQRLDATGDGFSPDPTVTGGLMTYLRTLVPNASLGQNSLRSDMLKSIDTANGGVYRMILDRGGDWRIQTATLAKVGDLRAVVDWVAGAGGYALELPAGFPSALTPTELASFDARLKANA